MINLLKIKQFSVMLFCFASLSLNAANQSSIAFSMENDSILRQDQGYTSGLFLSYNSAATNSLDSSGPFGIKHLASLLPLNDQYMQAWRFTIGQKIWSPVDITNAQEQENSRPYAGLLFFKSNIFEYSPQLTNKYIFMFGKVGPSSYAEESQSLLHEIIGSDEPLGWEGQIENKWVFLLGYESQRLLMRKDVGIEHGYDVSWTGRINIGNHKSELAIGSFYRWGINLEENFGSVGFTSGNYLDASVLSSSITGAFVFSGIEGRYRFTDITIDGDRPEHLYDINIKNWQTSVVIGIAYYQKNYGVSFNLTLSSAEYQEDANSQSTTGTVEFFYRL